LLKESDIEFLAPVNGALLWNVLVFLGRQIGAVWSYLQSARIWWVVSSVVDFAFSVINAHHTLEYVFKTVTYAVCFCLTILYGAVRGTLVARDRSDLNFYVGRLFTKVAPFLGITLTVEGAEHLKNLPCVFVVNHQSTIDVLCVGSFIPKNTAMIGKKSLAYVPLLAWYLWMSNNVVIDRQNHEQAMRSLEAVGREVRDKRSAVLVFPEGTRSRTYNKMLPFKKGCFNLAVGGQVPIVPIVISNQKSIYDSKKKFFHGGEIKIKGLPPPQKKTLLSLFR